MTRIVFISIDSLRFDALSCEHDTRYLRRYGLEQARRTPVLDRLAAEGVWIRQAIAAAPHTTTSHASMLTGSYPPRHGVRAFLGNTLSRSAWTLAERLRGHGYRTIASIDMADLFRVAGLTRGFDEVIRHDDSAVFERLDASRTQHLFLFAHFEDVHWPFGESPCPPWDGYNNDMDEAELRRAALLGLAPARPGALSRADLAELAKHTIRDAEARGIADTLMFPHYLEGVNKFDAGRLRRFVERLRTLGMLDDTLLIITGDHGDAPLPSCKRADPWIPMKFSHAGGPLVEELIRVPLIIHAPGRLPAGKVVDAQVSLVDLAPTVLEYAGLRPPRDCDGHSLRGLLEGHDDTGRDVAYSESWYHDSGQLEVADTKTFLFQASVRTPCYKYVETGSELTPEEMALPEAGFARAVAQKIFGVAYDPAHEWTLTRILARGASREAVVAELQDRHVHRRSLYDLVADPHEDVNLLGVDMGQAALGRSPRYAGIATSLAERLAEVQRNAVVAASGPSAAGSRSSGVPSSPVGHRDGARPVEERTEGARRALRLAYDAALLVEAPVAAIRPEAQALSTLEHALALCSLGELAGMRAQLLRTIEKNPEVVDLPAARAHIATMARRLATASDAPMETTRRLCADIGRTVGVRGHRSRARRRQTLADVWTAVAMPLSLGWDGRTDVRAAGTAAFRAVLCDPVRIRRGGLLWVMARAVLGPRVSDPIRRMLKRLRAATIA